MNIENWDPLAGDLTPELVNATIKRQIKNILKSYTGWYDPFSELIQNALDALEARAARDDEFAPELWIQIDLNQNTLSVTDNGIGFSEDQFRSFLAPNVSFKSQENRGNKGVGATYLAYGFNFLQVGTKTPDYELIGTLTDGREWVEGKDENNTEPRPKVSQENEASHSAFSEVDQGATFTLKLIGEFIRPQRLDWLNANTANQWSAILRIKTPLGGIYFGAEPPKIQCTLKVIDKNGKETTENLKDCKYLFPHKIFRRCLNYDEIRSARIALMDEGKESDDLPLKYFELDGLYKYWDTDSLISENQGLGKRLGDHEKRLARQYNLKCYGFFCYTRQMWDEYNDSTLGIRKGERILTGGLQLATNTMPQGDLILIPLERLAGYQHTTHVVIHLDQADPDLGRKGFQPEIQELSKNISTYIVSYFLDGRVKHLKKATGAPPDIIDKKDIHDWILELEEHEKQNPLIITRKDAFLPLMKPSITAEPRSEQDVISLFNQLLAGGVIRGVRLMATSQHNKYDSVFKAYLEKPFENYEFHEDKNPLGLESSRVSKEFISRPSILEYKYSFESLIEEIEKESKDERDIDLVVAWKLGENWHDRYKITSLLHHDNLQHRYFHGITHEVRQKTETKVFYLIILSELICYLNDPDSAQEYQAATYEI